MKMLLTLLALALMLSTSAFAKIVTNDGQFFIKTKKGTHPIMSVNELIEKKEISQIKMYGKGNVHVLSFATKKGPEKLYSVDQKGFIYSIKPFSDYSISKVDANGKFQFKQVPKRNYVVDAKGFFFY